jgi:hypothetical protein
MQQLYPIGLGKILFPLSILLFFFSACNPQADKGLMIYAQSKLPYSGSIVDTVGDRIVSFQVKNGLKDGEFIIMFLNGNKEVHGTIRSNKNEGKWNYFYSNGKLESEGLFKNDKPDSKWTWYYPNGSKKEEGNFIMGKREGLWKQYNEDETIKSEVFYKSGNEIYSDKQKSLLIS